MRFSTIPGFPFCGVASPPVPGTFSERGLIGWWKALAPGHPFHLSNGDTAHLVDGGRINRHDGPDIREATFLVDGEIRRGDVECHVRESDWYQHGHHGDSRYRNVILHVVAAKGDRRAVTEGGDEIAAVVASPLGRVSPSPVTCRLEGKVSREELMDGIVPLAYGRWLERVDIMRTAIRTCGEPRQAFFIHSFWALGLKGNEQPFVRLARETPLSKYRSLSSLEDITAVLLGCGGFFAGVGGSPGLKLDRCRAAWSVLSGQFRPVVEYSRWVRRGLRPAAYPERRMEFGAALVRALLQGWEPWQRTFDGSFQSLRGVFSPSLLPGRGWCGEWLGNVILPAQEGWNQLQGKRGDGSLFRRWFDIDLGYVYGEVRRRFESHVLRKDLTNFGVQQGLLSLIDGYCRLDLCRVCPLRS